AYHEPAGRAWRLAGEPPPPSESWRNRSRSAKAARSHAIALAEPRTAALLIGTDAGHGGPTFGRNRSSEANLGKANRGGLAKRVLSRAENSMHSQSEVSSF